MDTKKLRVGVLFGGKSAEHEVSIESAKNVMAALQGYDVVPIKIEQDGSFDIEKIKKVDIVFPVLHGTYGEDGTMQGFLEIMDIPYVGPGVLGSAIAMDKDVTKRLLREAGIAIANFLVFKKNDPIANTLGWPVFVKPANLGSSVGVSKANNETEFAKAVELAFRYDRKILVEEFIDGEEIECSVLGNDTPMASLPGRVVPRHEFYSYEAKYIDEHGAILEIPAKLPEEIIKKIQETAVKAYQTLCLQGMARVDMFLLNGKDIIMNEANTIPGFTNISMYPKLWEASGLPYSKLLDRLIDLALERRTWASAISRKHN